MAIKALQVEKGKLKIYGTPGEDYRAKKYLHRERERRRIKADTSYEPQYNRYDGWLI